MSADGRVTPRARARAEMTGQIKDVARRHLAVDGPDLSLRAVARDIGVVSSAVYRYFPSRDELLTALIVDGYVALADAVDEAEARVPRRDVLGRWRAVGDATRAWAIARPHEYALLYGSPVPGYAAPAETIEPASRPVLVAAAILRDAWHAERLVEPPAERMPRVVRAEVTALAAQAGFGDVPVGVVTRVLAAWTQLFGMISFELFGRLTNAIDEHDAYFEHQWRAAAAYVGLTA